MVPVSGRVMTGLNGTVVLLRASGGAVAVWAPAMLMW